MEKVIDIRPIKKQMRSSCKEARRSMDKVVKANYDKKIQNKLLNLFLIREAECNITDADKLAQNIKTCLGGSVRYVDAGRKIEKVLVCSGSGGGFLTDVIANGYDALIAADIKHNVFMDAINNGVSVLDIRKYIIENNGHIEFTPSFILQTPDNGFIGGHTK